MDGKLHIREDGSEVVPYHYDGYYAYVSGGGKLSGFRNLTTDLHWHLELELSLLLSGRMNYSINDETVTVEPGQGIIINSRQLHRNYAYRGQDCSYQCILLHPMLLCATPALEERFVTPVLKSFPGPYLILHPEVEWENEILRHMKEIVAHRDEASAPLLIQSHFYQIWALLRKNLPSQSKTRQPADSRLSLLKELLSYIQHHYSEALTLEDIARRGSISKSSCLALFRQYVGDTPVHYLISCRLKAGAALLRETDLPVTEIAYQVGFSNLSYFTERFHKLYGRTPLEYRKGRESERPHEAGEDPAMEAK